MIALDDTRDLLQQYLKDVTASQPLSAGEEKILARRIKKGDINARNELVQANLRFAIRIAREYQNRGLSLIDLISAGNTGLITAAERFDETRGFKFISYAVWWIRQAIQQALAEDPRIMRLPMNRLDLLRRISGYVETQYRKTAHIPDEEEIAGELGVSVKMVRDTMIIAQNICSLDTAFGDDDRENLLEQIADDRQESPDVQLMRNSLKEDIEAALETLGERERDVIKLYFGLDGMHRANLEEIGKRFNVTRERIRQIKEKALSKLRRFSRAQKLMTYAEEIDEDL